MNDEIAINLVKYLGELFLNRNAAMSIINPEDAYKVHILVISLFLNRVICLYEALRLGRSLSLNWKFKEPTVRSVAFRACRYQRAAFVRVRP